MKQTTFWGRDEHDERLVEEILRGVKTATCTPLFWYEQDDDQADVGELLAVHSKLGAYMCTIEITEKYVVPFGQIDERVAREENCASLEEFMQDHVFAWEEDMRKEGVVLDAETPIVVEHFRLVQEESTRR